jgi:threonine/homoserine/homoserine lactone efflux protein
MFDYTFAHWSTFFIAAVLLNLTPGPDIAYVLAHTVKNGLGSGFADCRSHLLSKGLD